MITSNERFQEGTDVFISYSRKDQDFVRWLNDRFREAGREPWIDWIGIQPGEEFLPAIFQGIDAANSFVFVLSPDSVQSTVCRAEAERAVSSKRMKHWPGRTTSIEAALNGRCRLPRLQ